MSLRLKLLASVAVVILLAVLVDVPKALGQLSGISASAALLASLLFLLTHMANAAKLTVLLPGRRFGTLLTYTLMAQAYALLLPGQLAGEAVKAYRLAQDMEPGVGHTAASAVIFDRVTAIGGVLVFTLAGLAASPHLFGAALGWGAALGLVGLVGAAALLAGERAGRLAVALGAMMPRAGAWGVVSRFLDAWRTMARRPRLVFLSLAWSGVAQLLAVAGSQALGLGLGIDLPFSVWCVVIGGLTVILLAPVSLGGIGVREASLVGLLGMLGVPAERAVALGLAILAFQILIGLVGLAADLIFLRKHDVKA